MGNTYNNKKTFKYSNGYNYFIIKIFPFIILIIFTIFIYMFIKIAPFGEIYIEFALFILPMPLAFILYINAYPEITVENDNLLLKFLFNTYIVNSKDVLNIVKLERMFLGDILRIDTNNLPFLYKIIGFLYGSKAKPSFLVRMDISDYEELINELVKLTKLKPQKIMRF